MSDPTGPRRPLPKSVYVRRRIAVLTIAVLVIAAIVVVVVVARHHGGGTAAPGGSSGISGQSPGDDSSLAGGDSSSGAPADGDACDPSRIAITASTDKQQYAAGDEVQIALTLTNNSSKDCVMAVGTDQQVFTIGSPSGDDVETYWASTDCQSSPTSQNQVLKAGVPISTPWITWDRHRSTPGNCGQGPVVGGGGATFEVQAKIGSLTSDWTKFYLY